MTKLEATEPEPAQDPPVDPVTDAIEQVEAALAKAEGMTPAEYHALLLIMDGQPEKEIEK